MLASGNRPLYASEVKHPSWQARLAASGLLVLSLVLMAYTIINGTVMSYYHPESTSALPWLFGLGFFAGGAYSLKVLVKGHF